MTKLERITAYRMAKNYKTAKAFAAFLGISPSQISEIDKKEKPAALMLALKTKTDLNLNWLETGEGDMTGISTEDLERRRKEAISAAENGQQSLASIQDRVASAIRPEQNRSRTRMMLEDLLDQESEEELKEMVFKLLEKQRGVKGGN